jgi:uncharacterized protein
MVLKVVAVLVIIFLIYILLFKKNREKDIRRKQNEKIEDEMMECPSCKIYVSQKEAILSNGKFYCSKECLSKK